MVRSSLATADMAWLMLLSAWGFGFRWSLLACAFDEALLLLCDFLGGGRFLTCEYFAGMVRMEGSKVLRDGGLVQSYSEVKT